ncbi:hypothetical protein [Sphingobacterium spiritivorum]|uniref:hypothetical protein n=1 Tax=Sphingobacterium spiritivorum TaxID=258 RepID=UPI0019180E9D|nr:hypothetical protein [Sphingobacterium spiritivorum]QQT25055.1 hypothetical protein I6J02_15160 [Sphingobacterium spiritivorum]
MEKFKVDYSEMSHFKGIRILYEYLEEGLDYARENGIREVCIWTEGDWSKMPVNFDFLKDGDFIETFHWLVPMSKKSDINGLKHMQELKNLRWSAAGEFNLDLSIFPVLEKLNISYGPKISGWDKLTSLKELLIGGVKYADLSFLKHAVNLEYLRIIGGSFESIEGLENCSKLTTLFLQKCNALSRLQPTIHHLNQLEQLNLEGCKKLNSEEQLAGLTIKHISIL